MKLLDAAFTWTGTSVSLTVHIKQLSLLPGSDAINLLRPYITIVAGILDDMVSLHERSGYHGKITVSRVKQIATKWHVVSPHADTYSPAATGWQNLPLFFSSKESVHTIESLQYHQQKDIEALGNLFLNDLNFNQFQHNRVAQLMNALFVAMQKGWCADIRLVKNLFQLLQQQLETNPYQELFFTENVISQLKRYLFNDKAMLGLKINDVEKIFCPLQVSRYLYSILIAEYQAKKLYSESYKIPRTVQMVYSNNEQVVFVDEKKEEKRQAVKAASKRYQQLKAAAEELPFSIMKMGEQYILLLQNQIAERAVVFKVGFDICKGVLWGIKVLHAAHLRADIFDLKMQYVKNERRVLTKMRLGGEYLVRPMIGKNKIVSAKHYTRMFYAGEEDLHTFLKRGFSCGMPIETRLHIATLMIDAIAKWHILFEGAHRDLKFENLVMNMQKSEVKPIDFEEAAEDGSIDKIPSIGTLPYVPPQPIQGRKGDIYTLGILLCMLLTAQLELDPSVIITKPDGRKFTDIARRDTYLTQWRIQIKEQIDPYASEALERMLDHDPDKIPNMPEVQKAFVNIKKKFQL